MSLASTALYTAISCVLPMFSFSVGYPPSQSGSAPFQWALILIGGFSQNANECLPSEHQAVSVLNVQPVSCLGCRLRHLSGAPDVKGNPSAHILVTMVGHSCMYIITSRPLELIPPPGQVFQHQ